MIRISRVILSQSPAHSTKSLAGKKLGVGRKDDIKRSWKEARQTQFQDMSMKQSLRRQQVFRQHLDEKKETTRGKIKTGFNKVLKGGIWVVVGTMFVIITFSATRILQPHTASDYRKIDS